MSIFLVALPLLLLIALANWVTARGSGARTAFHLTLFLLHLLLLSVGVVLRLRPPNLAALLDLGGLPLDPAFAGGPLIGIGLWGMVVALRPARSRAVSFLCAGIPKALRSARHRPASRARCDKALHA